MGIIDDVNREFAASLCEKDNPQRKEFIGAIEKDAAQNFAMVAVLLLLKDRADQSPEARKGTKLFCKVILKGLQNECKKQVRAKMVESNEVPIPSQTLNDMVNEAIRRVSRRINTTVFKAPDSMDEGDMKDLLEELIKEDIGDE